MFMQHPEYILIEHKDRLRQIERDRAQRERRRRLQQGRGECAEVRRHRWLHVPTFGFRAASHSTGAC